MSGTGSKGHVLIVEDDVILARLIARALQARGTSVEIAHTAEDAERRLLAGPQPSMVLLDIGLPGETGWSLFRRGVLGAPGSAPAVVTSATPISSAELRQFRTAGYLPKPFALSALTDCVDRLSPQQADGAPGGVKGPVGVGSGSRSAATSRS